MKMTIIAFLFAPIMAQAQLMFDTATADMSAEDALAVCTFKNTELDFQTVSVNAQGDMVLKVNPIYLDGEMTPYLIYKGLVVTEAQDTVRIQGQIVTLGGLADIDMLLERGKVNQVVFLEESLSCKVK